MALDPFVPAAAGATTAAPPRGGHVGPQMQRAERTCVPSSAEADRRATLSFILTGVTGFARCGVVGGTTAAVAPALAGRATPATPVNI